MTKATTQFVGWCLLFYAVLACADVGKFVYEVPTTASIPTVLNGVRDHLNSAGGNVKIAVVAYGKGVDLLLANARDENGNLYQPAVEELVKRGVEFRACGTTLEFHKIDASRVIHSGTIVPGGISEIERLKNEEGYVPMN
jgi:intracellular sulfur oxidation DsrE/DsrF family protein